MTPRTTRPFSGRLSQQSTVNGRRPSSRRRASARTRKPGAERGASGCARSWTMSGCVAVQSPGRGLVAVALLGDGQADDADPGVGHRREHRLRVLAGDEDVLDRLDDARGLAGGAELERGVGEVLGAEQVALGRAHQADADDAPVAAGSLHRLGDVDRAVGAEEGAEPEVDDADAGAVGAAPGEAGGISGQGGLRCCGRRSAGCDPPEWPVLVPRSWTCTSCRCLRREYLDQEEGGGAREDRGCGERRAGRASIAG